MLTSPKVDRQLSTITQKKTRFRYQMHEDLFVQTHPDKQFTPWNTEDHQRSPYRNYPHELLSLRTPSRNKPSHSSPMAAQAKSKGFTYRRRTYDQRLTQKETSLRTNLISLSLERDTKEDLFGLRPRKSIENWKQQPNRVKELKKKLEAKQKSLKAQQMQTYNKAIQMFSTCLTERFTKDLVQDALMIYPVMPKRQPKVDLNRRKFQESQPPSNSCLPNLTISVERSVQKQTNEGLQVENGSTGCKLKGEEIKNKIRYLMLREKVSPDTEDEYCSSARESKGVNIKE